MPPWTFSWTLALLLWPGTLCGGCPRHCSCSVDGSVFCTQRRAASMPVNLPNSTRQLYVFQNGITALREHDVLGLVYLVSLDLSQNQLSRIPDGVFGSLGSLQNLDLSSNHVGRISRESFAGLASLERLYLHGNRICTIDPDAFVGLGNLLELKLQGNQIDTLPALKLPRLLLLDIGYNRAMPLPGPEGLQTPHLESLKVAGLGLTALDEGLIRSLGNLHDLDVSHNKLTELPAVLRSARGLTGLSLGGNPLGPLAREHFVDLTGLQRLDLSGLNLRGFPAGFLQAFPRLTHLMAAENPFDCACTLAWFPRWLRDGGVELGRREETRCHFPPRNAGRELFRLEHRDFGCSADVIKLSQVLTTHRTETTSQPTTVWGTSAPTPDPLSTFEPLANSKKDVASSFHSSGSMEREEHVCPADVCLNGGTCRFDQGGQLDCFCPPDASGRYCENREEPRPSPAPPSTPALQPGTIGSHRATGTSISLDLHRYVEARPRVRGIRLTYRNLSGPDRRPQHLNVPPSYPEYTLRGLQPNSTYVVCASPLGEPGVEEEVGGAASCLETRTSGISPHPPAGDEPEPEPFSLLVPILAAAAALAVLALVVALVLLCRKMTKTPAHPSPVDLEGAKVCLESGSASQTRPERLEPPQDYETLLIREPFASNNNNDRVHSYF